MYCVIEEAQPQFKHWDAKTHLSDEKSDLKICKWFWYVVPKTDCLTKKVLYNFKNIPDEWQLLLMQKEHYLLKEDTTISFWQSDFNVFIYSVSLTVKMYFFPQELFGQKGSRLCSECKCPIMMGHVLLLIYQHTVICLSLKCCVFTHWQFKFDIFLTCFWYLLCRTIRQKLIQWYSVVIQIHSELLPVWLPQGKCAFR